MSRTKKSRKPGGAPTAKPKLSKVELANVEKRVRKKTGKKPGNRQHEGKQDNHSDHKTHENKDPRIGSKKPIELGNGGKLVPKPSSVKTKKISNDPIAAIRSVKANVEQSLAEQLEVIETDERLQVILGKQEDELALTEAEVNYYNDLMERHQAISEQLDNEDKEPMIRTKSKSADDLWEKLDSTSLSDTFLDDDDND